MPVTIYFQKSTGLKQSMFKLTEFGLEGIVRTQYVKIKRAKLQEILKSEGIEVEYEESKSSEKSNGPMIAFNLSEAVNEKSLF